MRAGCYKVSDFLGNFFIRKCMWSTPTSIRSNAASFKKFYKSMLEHGHILQDDFDFLRCVIKDDLKYWCDLCEAYNMPGSANPFSPFGSNQYGPLDGYVGGGMGTEESDIDVREVLVGMVDELIEALHAEGFSDEDILTAMVGSSEDIEERLALYDASDEQVLAKIASTGVPADPAELKQLMREQGGAPLVVDELCARHGVELDENAFGWAEWAIAILHDRWVEDL